MASLERTALAIETCKRHIAAIPNDNTDKSLIAAYLGSVACVVFYSEMESQVKLIIQRRLKAGGDAKLAQFLFNTNEAMLKRIKKTDIAETVALFGDEIRNQLNDEMAPERVSKYSNVIVKRHDAAHGSDLNVTIDEVEEAMTVAEELLQKMEALIA